MHATTSKQIAETILTQLGGSRLVAMTGARNFVQLDAGLALKLGRGGLCSHVRIDLDLATDTYTVTTMKVRGMSSRVLQEVAGVHVGQLRGTMEQVTGFYLSL